MSKIANTIICFGIATILLFFGLNLDDAEVLFYTQNTNTVSNMAVALYSGEATISEVETPMSQLISTQNETVVHHLEQQGIQGKKDAKMLLFIVVALNLLEQTSNSDKVILEMKSPDIYHRVAVLNYIHDLDGKKRV